MNRSNEEGELKKKITEVKTFPIPFALGEIKENISISTNTPSKPSKEQVINQAFKFHSQGNISEAAKYYQHFIDQGFKDHRVFSNYGEILQGLGKTQESEMLYRKALEIKPDFAEALHNLGIILKDIGNLKESESCLRKADYISPNNIDSKLNLGIILHQNGNSKEALEIFLKGIKIDPKNQDLIGYASIVFQSIDPSEIKTDKLRLILNLFLNSKEINHNNLFICFNYLYKSKLDFKIDKENNNIYTDKYWENIINDELLLKALKNIVFKSAEWEIFLTSIRKFFCNSVANHIHTMNQRHIRFVISLAEQCFLNEYVYNLDEDEKLYIEKIVNRCLEDDGSIAEISLLSCYYPLYKLVDKLENIDSLKSINKDYDQLLKVQLLDPIIEQNLSKSLKRVGSIKDYISRKVKSQYEENPYPRWKSTNTYRGRKVSVQKVINSEIKPNHIRYTQNNHKLKVLIAGCGTGSQIIQAQKYKSAEITAIDLSSASLSYAQRKLNELNIKNVEIIQMDILDLSLINKTFDIIECCGVLHHMSDPEKGLKSIISVLETNGFMKISLYSSIARQHINAARKYIKAQNIEPTHSNIRNFRKNILSGKLPKLYPLGSFNSDFFTLSECRDLCFHFQEHQFNIEEIEQMLIKNNLAFLGFTFPFVIKALYQNYFPDDKKQINLKNIALFEAKHPKFFLNTPSFWVGRNTKYVS